MQRINEIDLLRFVAAVAVMVFHYTFRGWAADGYLTNAYGAVAPLSKYGYLGVELFFLISGFVILMTASSGSLGKFAVSRVVRLYPAYWFCCTVTFAVAAWLGAGRFAASWPQYLANLTMFNEFFGVKSVDGVYWSLAVELKFYFLVALLLLAGQIHHAQRYLLIWLVAVAALHGMPVERLRSLLIADYAPYFIGGAVAYLVYHNGPSVTRLAMLAGALGLALVDAVRGLGGFARKFGHALDPWIVGGLITLFFGLMLLVALRRTGRIGRIDWTVLGVLTYPLYLIHQNIGYMLINLGAAHVNLHVLVWGSMAGMLLAAYAINRLVEVPLASGLKRGLRRVVPA